jgi:tight adherence protein B
MNWNNLLFLSLIFISVSLFLFASLQIWNASWGESAGAIQRRLRSITGDLGIENQSLIKTRALSHWRWLHELMQEVTFLEAFDGFLTQAGLTMTVARFAFYQMVSAVCVAGLSQLWGMNLIQGILLAVVPGLGWLVGLQYRRRERVRQMEAQMPDTLDLMARAMQAGHAFSSALLIVGTDGAEPIRGEFQTTFDEINFGIPTDVALHHLTLRVASRDLRFFVVAVLIQLETGGNLTEILKSLAELIRERQRIAGNVRVLSAEGRLSAWILGLLPFAIALLLSVINPEFISVLWTDPMGVHMLQISLGLMLIGILWMWQMVHIRI